MRVIVRIGRSILPATSQPARTARTATAASAIPESTRSWCESDARCAAWTDPACATWCTACATWLGGLRQSMLVLGQLPLVPYQERRHGRDP